MSRWVPHLKKAPSALKIIPRRIITAREASARAPGERKKADILPVALSLWKESVIRAGAYAYRDRRVRKREFRRLWILRINAAVRQRGMRYSEFIHALQQAKIGLNRKMMAEMAVNDPEAFDQLVDQVKAASSATA